MSQELPDKLTPVTREEIIGALWRGWTHYFGTTPQRKESVWVIASQWALETGWGGSMHCYNMGNVKSVPGDGYDWTYYECNEALPRVVAERYQTLDPTHARITSHRQDGKCWIWFYPPHAGCRFRAFHTLDEGATDQVAILAKTFKDAWKHVIDADVDKFSHELHAHGYYTADEVAYTRVLRGTYSTISKLKIDYDGMPIMSDEERRRLNDLILTTIMRT